MAEIKRKAYLLLFRLQVIALNDRSFRLIAQQSESKQVPIHSALRGQNMRVRSLSLWPPSNSTPRPLPIELWSRTNLSDKCVGAKNRRKP